MKQLVRDVKRIKNGVITHVFTGTDDECHEWIFNRTDFPEAGYTIGNPYYIEV